MAITINVSPETVDFCKNPIAFKVTSNASPVKLVARIFIEEVYGSGSYTQLPDIYHDVDGDGSAIFHIGAALEDYFETIKTDIFSISAITKDNYSLKKYYVEFYEWDGSSLSSAETSSTRYLLYGKLDYQDWPNHTFITTLTSNTDYLNNIGTKIRTWQTAKHYLYFLNHVSGTNDIVLKATIYYTDKSNETQTIDTYSDAAQYDVLIVPAGFTQLDLGTYSGSKTAYKYELNLWNGSTQVGKTITFEIGNKPWWGKQFLFRNNYGVLEAVIAEGKEESEVKADFETSKKRTQYDYAATDFEYVQRVKSRTKEYKCNIGPLLQTEAEHLEEMLNDKLFKVGDDKLIPCNILSKSIKPYDEDEDLQVVELKYQYAFEL